MSASAGRAEPLEALIGPDAARAVDRAVAVGVRSAGLGSGEGFEPRRLAVAVAGRGAGGAPRYRVRPRRLTERVARRALRTPAGVFLSGATHEQARQWAQRAARGGAVVFDAPHVPGGRPHFHIEWPGGDRSGHIFYGAPPGGEFFGAGDQIQRRAPAL
jgi:hypothetical protein